MKRLLAVLFAAALALPVAADTQVVCSITTTAATSCSDITLSEAASAHGCACRLVDGGGGGAEPSVYDDAIALWKLDEESDGSAPVTRVDSIGSNDLTDNNTVGSTSKGVGAPANLPDTVASFVAANDEYLSGMPPAEFEAGSARSVSFWFLLSAEGNASIFHIGTTGGVGRFLMFGAGTEPDKTVNLYAGGGFDTSGGFYGLNEWHLGVYTFDGGTTHKFYVDNDLKVTRTVADSGDTTALLLWKSAAGSVNGLMSSVAYFDFELDTDQIAELYNSGDGAPLP